MAHVDENGEKHLILCRVILGKCEKIELGSLELSHSRIDFDTGVDDLKNPQWYGVWAANMTTRVIPECVLSYKPGNREPGNFFVSQYLLSIEHWVVLHISKFIL